jgi:formylglycine-generating enzyme required for sulfatase activity
MKRKQIILVALAAVLLVVVALAIALWRVLSRPTGLSVPLELVEIPPGEFIMGSPATEAGRQDDETQHPVRITYAFKMGKTEVTQKQWREVMGTTIQQQRDKAQEQSSLWRSSLGERLKELGEAIKDNPFGAFERIKDNGAWQTLKAVALGEERWLLDGEGDDYPMYYVSWDDAMEFCARLTEQERVAGRLPDGYAYRLPTEAEWEYSCRAGSTTRYANSDTDADLDAIGWFGGNADRASHPVGVKLANAWGLYDMHGNIFEWCLDWYENYPVGRVTDPHGAQSGSSHVNRGGSWERGAANCRSAHREEYAPSVTGPGLGFRVVLAPVRLKE